LKVNESILAELFSVIQSRKSNPPAGSYTARLFEKGPVEIAKKVGEETVEVIVASAHADRGRLIYESADLIYHLLVLLAAHDVELDEVLAELERRRK
jgi:phosphoribosyl-ATP pyrophosphohydrolase